MISALAFLEDTRTTSSFSIKDDDHPAHLACNGTRHIFSGEKETCQCGKYIINNKGQVTNVASS